MLMLPTLHNLLSQVLAPPYLHTAVLLTPAGELVSAASEPSRPKDEIRIIVGLSGEVWQETREQGCGMVDSELGRIIVLPVDEFSSGHEQPFSDEHQPLMLLALNAMDTVEWEELDSKGKTLAGHIAKPLSKFRELIVTSKPSRSTTVTTSPAPHKTLEANHANGIILQHREQDCVHAGNLVYLFVTEPHRRPGSSILIANVTGFFPFSRTSSLPSPRPPIYLDDAVDGLPFDITFAQQIEPTTRSRPEPIPIKHEPQTRPRPDPYLLVAPELTHIRKNMLNLLGTAHPGLADMAEYYFLQPSKQLRSLLILLFSRATNGLGRNWERKHWDAACEASCGQSEELDRPLALSNVLNEWNPSMPDHTESFESVFALQQAVPRPEHPPPPPSSPLTRAIPGIISPPSLLPTQIRLAQIVEMVHVAFQLHEGITKGSDAESSKPTMQTMGFGNKLSILGGDFLLGRASTALSCLGESEVVELVASVISNLVEGEFLRMEEIRTPELGVMCGPKSVLNAWELYLRKTYLRTASLMAKGACSAVVLGGCREGDIWKEVAYAYGRNLGIAYQLLEDALDIKHMQPGLATGPALFASEECPRLVTLIQRNFTEEGDTELAVGYIQGTSGVERTRLLASAYADKARDVLQLLPDSETKTALEVLTEMAIRRSW
ncbi:hypothetical protein NLJ89_g5082 [Agrocybe chaxingu]|uniref:Uncharacterized protein n=1 Tax=Agrocybe chaxingu TaxID=84603 RepID=A0A9W8JZ88_9AGAR|nr:hypothetical protein NLJ89_g5082 [Agrocybe chaxingu]